MQINSRKSIAHIFEVVAPWMLAAQFLVMGVFSHPDQSEYWTIGTAISVSAFVLFAISILLRGERLRFGAVDFAVFGLLLLIAFSLLPLPIWLVKIISPSRAAWAVRSAHTAGNSEPSWLMLSSCYSCSRNAFLQLFGYWGIYFISSLLVYPRHRTKLAAMAVGGAMGVFIFVLYGILNLRDISGYRLRGWFTNPNRAAAYAALGAAVSLSLFYYFKRSGQAPLLGRRIAYFFAAAGATILLGLVLTLSRMGIAAVVVSVVCGVAFFSSRSEWKKIFTAMMVMLALSASMALSPVLARFSVLYESSSGLSRIACWKAALQMVGDYPIFGTGAGTFTHAFRVYQPETLPGWFGYAHFEYLNILSDLGIFGLLFSLVAIYSVARALWQMRNNRDSFVRVITMPMAMGLGAVLIHALADFPLREPAVASLFFMMSGVVVGARNTNRGELQPAWGWDVPRPSFMLIPIIVISFVVICLSVGVSRASFAVARAAKIKLSSNNLELEERAKMLARASELDSRNGHINLDLARTCVARLKGGALDANTAEGVLEAAKAEIRRGILYSPLMPRAYYQLGVLLWRHGDTSRTDELMLMAHELAPSWSDVLLSVGGYFLQSWRVSKRAEFGPSSWQQAKHELVFKRAGALLFRAARSPKALAGAVRLVIKEGCSAREIDQLLRPDAEIELALANEYYRWKDFENAAERLQRGIEQNGFTTDWRVHARLAVSLIRLGEAKKSEPSIARAFELAGGAASEEVFRELSFEQVLQKDLNWVAEYLVYLNGEAFKPVGALALARVYRRLKQHSKANATFEEFLRLLPDAAVHYEFARYLYAQKEFKSAARHAEASVYLAPEGMDAHVLVVRAHKSAGDVSRARQSLLGSVLGNPRELRLVRLLALEYKRERDFEALEQLWANYLNAGGDKAIGQKGLAEAQKMRQGR